MFENSNPEECGQLAMLQSLLLCNANFVTGRI